MAHSVCEPEEKKNDQVAMLYTVSDHITISEDRFIICNNEKSWHQIGVNHTLNTANDNRTSWSIKIGSSPVIDIMIGIATNDIVSQKNGHSGNFMYGWVFGSGGYQYHFGTHRGTLNEDRDEMTSANTLKWAPNDVIKIEFINYSLLLYINDVKVCKWEMKQYPGLENVNFIPVICINNVSRCQYLGLTEH